MYDLPEKSDEKLKEIIKHAYPFYQYLSVIEIGRTSHEHPSRARETKASQALRLKHYLTHYGLPLRNVSVGVIYTKGSPPQNNNLDYSIQLSWLAKTAHEKLESRIAELIHDTLTTEYENDGLLYGNVTLPKPANYRGERRSVQAREADLILVANPTTSYELIKNLAKKYGTRSQFNPAWLIRDQETNVGPVDTVDKEHLHP